MTDNGKKVCKKCGKEQPISEFPLRRDTSDGHAGSCKACFNLNRKYLRKLHKEKDAPKRKPAVSTVVHWSLYDLATEINKSTGSATIIKDQGGYIVGHYFVEFNDYNQHACLYRVANSDGWFYDVFDCGFILKDKLRKKMEDYLSEIKQESSWVLDGKVKPEREK